MSPLSPVRRLAHVPVSAEALGLARSFLHSPLYERDGPSALQCLLERRALVAVSAPRHYPEVQETLEYAFGLPRGSRPASIVAAMAVPPHVDEGYEAELLVYWVLDNANSRAIVSGEVTVVAQAGDVVLLNPSAPHALRGQPGGAPWLAMGAPMHVSKALCWAPAPRRRGARALAAA